MSSLALINGKVYREKGVFAEAVYCEDGIIKCVGGSEEVLAKTDWDTDIIDLEGKTVIPGLNDSHMHLMMVGTSLLEVQTSDVTSMQELIDRCRNYISENPELCRGGLYSCGWNQDLFTDEKRIPNRHDLDKISTEIPVVLARVCGHVVSCNTKTLEILGYEKWQKPAPGVGGTIELEEDGYPSGVFSEDCSGAPISVIPGMSHDDFVRAFEMAQQHALETGLTSVQSNDVTGGNMGSRDYFALLHEMYDTGKGKIRYRHQVACSNIAELQYYIDNEYTKGVYDDPDMLCLGPLKLFKDGSLGGRTALMRKEYADDPGNFGVATISCEDMDAMCEMASKAGMQIVTHVIGDGAIDSVLTNYEHITAGGMNPLRHGLVHCQITDKEMMQRIADDNVLIMYQPVFLGYDLHICEARVGRALASTSYAFKTAQDLGIHVSYGTDSPVEDCNPFHCICHAVTRKDKNGDPYFGFFPAECVSVEDAIDAYTIGSAYNEFKENRKGRIKMGYLADMLILDTDIFSCDLLEIYDILPEKTIIGGEVVYSK